MLRLITAAFCFVSALSSTANAGERQRLGYGILFTNDLIGDGHDRWRTGSIASSRVWGPEWTGQAPDRFGQLLEFRINGEVIAPENLKKPAAGDRPYAGALSFGLHSHFMAGQTDMALGADLVFTGSQTGLDDFQSELHDLLNDTQVSSAVSSAQVGNDVHPTLVFEAGRNLGRGAINLRPFVETRWGVETMIRTGVDLTLGQVGQGELMIREPVTGQRYRAIQNPFTGFSFIVGADVAYVEDNDFLPASSGVKPRDIRTRVRVGAHWEGENGRNFFYGLTWLGKEFKGQRESQVVGSVRLKVKF